MAFTKKGGDNIAAESTTEVPVAQTTKARQPLTIAAIVGGGVLALGAAFGVGLVAGHAAPAFPGGPDFAAGAGPLGGHGDGDRDGDHRGGPHGGQQGFQAPGANGQHGPGDGDGDGGPQGGQGQQGMTPPQGGQTAPNSGTSTPAPSTSTTP